MVQRLSYRRHNHYNTRSNKVCVVKLPGGRNAFHYLGKTSNPVKCSICSKRLHGISSSRSRNGQTSNKNKRRVSRAYGGNACHKCVIDKIKYAFLEEEENIAKAVIAEKKKQKIEAAKETTKQKKSVKNKNKKE